jgi:RNA polymerase sigma factor (sigma-70 family)
MTYTESPPADSATNRPAAWPARNDVPLVRAVCERTALENQFYVRYRRPLLQVLLQRRIRFDVAEDLLQRAFEQALKKIRSEGGLEDPSNLGGYLYRTACNLATVYWRAEFPRQHDGRCELLSNLPDEALSLEERVDHEQLAENVRELMEQLPLERDREVLERYYLHEEPRAAIRESLRLTDLQFNQVLWRARQRFGDILRRHGLVEDHEGSEEQLER